MSVTGDWKLQITTPMGEQKAELAIAADLTGTIAAMGETTEISGGTFAGDKLGFTASVTRPFPLTLDFSLTVSGDTITGLVKAGAMGNMPVSGGRA